MMILGGAGRRNRKSLNLSAVQVVQCVLKIFELVFGQFLILLSLEQYALYTFQLLQNPLQIPPDAVYLGSG